jgi:hypothetical protein
MIRDGMLRYHDALGPLLVDIDSVSQDPENYNNGDVDAIVDSIRKSGMYRPIFVQESTGHIIAGNHTWEACKTLQATRIPVVFLDVEDVDSARIMLADNRLAALARPDNGLLLRLLERIADDGDLDGSGYTNHELENIRRLNDIPLDANDDFVQWPTLSIQIPPDLFRAFMVLTHEADNDVDRFELLMRLAGWQE